MSKTSENEQNFFNNLFTETDDKSPYEIDSTENLEKKQNQRFEPESSQQNAVSEEEKKEGDEQLSDIDAAQQQSSDGDEESNEIEKPEKEWKIKKREKAAAVYREGYNKLLAENKERVAQQLALEQKLQEYQNKYNQAIDLLAKAQDSSVFHYETSLDSQVAAARKEYEDAMRTGSVEQVADATIKLQRLNSELVNIKRERSLANMQQYAAQPNYSAQPPVNPNQNYQEPPDLQYSDPQIQNQQFAPQNQAEIRAVQAMNKAVLDWVSSHPILNQKDGRYSEAALKEMSDYMGVVNEELWRHGRAGEICSEEYFNKMDEKVLEITNNMTNQHKNANSNKNSNVNQLGGVRHNVAPNNSNYNGASDNDSSKDFVRGLFGAELSNQEKDRIWKEARRLAAENAIRTGQK